ncbi:hypothetical protein ABBQ32_007291 [Trebouxia sp. C0010 RCD-2024]
MYPEQFDTACICGHHARVKCPLATCSAALPCIAVLRHFGTEATYESASEAVLGTCVAASSLHLDDPQSIVDKACRTAEAFFFLPPFVALSGQALHCLLRPSRPSQPFLRWIMLQIEAALHVYPFCCNANCIHAVAEAHAALTAVQWQLGQAAKAEEHFAIATAIDSRWKRTSYIQSQTRWPPKLYVAMEKFLSIVPG